MMIAEKLVAEYIGSLDSSLILAICSEYDDETEARSVLQALADNAGASTSQLNLESNLIDDSGSSGGGSTLATDDDQVERAFHDWTTSQHNDDRSLQSSVQDTAVTPFDRESDPISFLKGLFPRRERIELDLALQDAGQDVESAIETLMTEDLLIREEEQDYLRWLTGGEDSSNGSAGQRNNKKMRPGKQTISLTSTPRVSSSRNSGATHLLQAAKDPPENVWAKTDSTVTFLALLLSVSPAQLTSLFYQYNNSLPLAVSKILDNAEDSFSSIEDGDASLMEMQVLFPEKHTSDMRRCLSATSGDLTKAIELLQTLQELYAKEGTPLAHKLLLQDATASRNTALAIHKPAPPGSNGIPADKRIGMLKQSASISRPPSAVECMTLAFTLRDRRDEAYRNAARSWRKQTALGSSGVAAYWADHGRQLDKQARSWDLQGARSLVNERRKHAQAMHVIDLHGLTVSQALTVTQECLNSWWHDPRAPSSFTIITGAGKHSSGQNPVLLPAVKKLLLREGFDAKEGDRWHSGSVTVYGLQGRRKATAF